MKTTSPHNHNHPPATYRPAAAAPTDETWRQRRPGALPMAALQAALMETLIATLMATSMVALMVALMATLTAAPAHARDSISIAQLAQNPQGKVLFMRHALAPGFGDPVDFNIDDHTTQRNLSDQGRRQAKSIGARLQQAGIQPKQIYSSQWRRCLETAALLSLGPVTPHSGLNSFFQGHADRRQTLASLQELLRSLDPTQGPYLFVTHQVVISSVTGVSPASGEIVVHDLTSRQAVRLDP